jgi:hypothetical protein
VFTSFLQTSLRTIDDIWDSNNTNIKSCHDIYNLLIDRRNCISEFSKTKEAIPEKFIKVLKGETKIVPERRATLNINDKLQFLNESNTAISPDKLKIKVIQGIFKLNIKPKCQIKREEQYGGIIDWIQIWTKLKKIKVTNQVKEFQWKCLHNINYTEHRLKKINLSNG